MNASNLSADMFMNASQLHADTACLRSKRGSPTHRKRGRRDPLVWMTSNPPQTSRWSRPRELVSRCLQGHLGPSAQGQGANECGVWRRVGLTCMAFSEDRAHLDVVLDVHRKRSSCVKSLRKIDVGWSSWHDCSINPQLSGLGVDRVTSRLENVHIDLGRTHATVRDLHCPSQHMTKPANTRTTILAPSIGISH